MKPLAMTLQLVLGSDDRRMYAEIEFVMDDGSIVMRRMAVNTRLRVNFDEIVAEAGNARKAG